jgi:hypothetical protein
VVHHHHADSTTVTDEDLQVEIALMTDAVEDTTTDEAGVVTMIVTEVDIAEEEIEITMIDVVDTLHLQDEITMIEITDEMIDMLQLKLLLWLLLLLMTIDTPPGEMTHLLDEEMTGTATDLVIKHGSSTSFFSEFAKPASNDLGLSTSCTLLFPKLQKNWASSSLKMLLTL